MNVVTTAKSFGFLVYDRTRKLLGNDLRGGQPESVADTASDRRRNAVIGPEVDNTVRPAGLLAEQGTRDNSL